MKLIIFNASLLLFLSFLVGCSNDNETENSKEEISLVGKWRLIAQSNGGQPETLTDCRKKETIEFFDNGKAENFFVDSEPCEYSTIMFDYQIDGNILTFKIDGEGNNGGIYILDTEISVLDSKILEYRSIWDSNDGEQLADDITTQKYERIN